jgi:hypothetical protein
MEVYYEPIKIMLGLLLTSGVGIGLFRIGIVVGSLQNALALAAKVDQNLDAFKMENSESHLMIRQDTGDVKERLAGVETRLASLPCNGDCILRRKKDKGP